MSSVPWIWINSGLSNDTIMEQLIPDIQLSNWVPLPQPIPITNYDERKTLLPCAYSELKEAENEKKILQTEYKNTKKNLLMKSRKKPGPRSGARNMLYNKPETYVQLVSKAILNCEDRCASLADIYEFVETSRSSIVETLPSTSWKNTVRHTLSTHEFFIRTGKADTGLGYIWSIHPQCIEMFENGDVDVRQARILAKENPIKQYCCSRKHKTSNI